MIPRIFIGGTGRSGTWLLYKILGSHEDICTFPTELRFIVNPGGLLELADALTDKFSPTLTRETLFRFERLMRVYLATYGKALMLQSIFQNGWAEISIGKEWINSALN